MKPSTPEMQIEIERLAKALRAVPVGSVLTYTDASKAIGRDVTNGARFVLQKARDAVEKSDGIRFGTVYREGIKRLAADDVPGIGREVRKRIGRAAKRGFNRMSGLSYNDIKPDIRAQIDAERSVLGAIHSLTAQVAVTKVSEGTQTGPMPAKEVARLIAAE